MESIKMNPERFESEPLPSELSDCEAEVRADHELLIQYQQTRDPEAFHTLVHRHQGMIAGIARRMLGCPHLAEDVVQATFLVLAKDSRKIRKRHSLVSWLYGVAYRISARVARQKAVTSVTTLEDKAMIAADPLEKLNAQFEQEAVFDELHRLPESLRAPLILRYLKGNSNLMVAKELNLSESAVEGRLKRARKTLRIRLARKGVAFGLAIGVLGLVQKSAVAAELSEGASQSLAQAVAPDGADPMFDSGASSEIVRLAEEEILKMATTKMFSVIAMSGIVAGMLATGWAVAGDFGNQQNNNPHSNGVLIAGAANSEDQPAVSIAGTSDQENADLIVSNVTNTTVDTSSNRKSLAERSMDVGNYSVHELPEKEIAILEKLKKEASFDYYETMLSDVIQEINATYELQILFDHKQMADYSIHPDELVSIKVDRIQLENALKLILDQLELTYVVDNEVMLITTRDSAADMSLVRIYEVKPNWQMNSQALYETIEQGVQPETWQGSGGNGGITLITNGLVVRAAPGVHDDIGKLMKQLDSLYQNK